MAYTDDYSSSPSTTGTLAVGGSTKGSFDVPMDSDWFKIHLEAGTSYVFAMTSQFGGDYLLNNASLNLYFNNTSVVVAWGANDTGPAIAYTPAVSGDYFIAAEGYMLDALPRGKLDYQISAAVQQPDALSADIHTTGVLTAGATVTGRFDVAGDVDWYKFHAEAGQHYTFSFPKGLLAPTFFSVYDAQGKELANPSAPLELSTAGDYFIAVGGNAVGDYNLRSVNRVDDYSGNDSTPGVLVAGSQATGRLDYVYDTDRFQMQVQAGQSYTIELAGDARDQDILVFQILDGQGKSIADTHPRNDGALPLSKTFTATTSGTYAIDVSVYDYRHTAYAPYTIKASNPIADDYGGTAATASPVDVGSTIQGTINFDLDVDVVKLSLQAGTTYVMTLTPDDPMSAQRISITDKDGKEIATSIYQYPDTNLTPTASGDYYVAISGKNGSHYTLAASAPADDFGANAGAAGTLAAGGAVSGTLERSADRDWFAIDMTAGATYELSLKNGAGARLLSGWSETGLHVVDAQGHVLAGVSINNEASGPQLSYRAASTGTYYVEVAAGQQAGNYVLNAALGTADDAGNTPATATRINFGAIKGRLEVSSDKDVYKVVVVAGQYYGFQITSPSGSSTGGLPDLSITDAQSQTLNFTSVRLSYDAFADYKLYYARTSGDIYLAVSERADAGPTGYQLLATSLGKDDYNEYRVKEAASLAIGAPMKGALNYAGDIDTVKVTLQQGMSYSFDLHNDSLTAPYGYRAVLYSSDGLQLAQTGGPFGSAFGYKAATGGDYYLSVQANVSDTHAIGGYTLTAALIDAAPQLAAPVAGASTPLGLTDNIWIDFDQKVLVHNGTITLTDADGKNVPIDWTAIDSAPLSHLGLHGWRHLAPGATYTLDIPSGAIANMAGNSFAGLHYTFSTVAAASEASDGNDILIGRSNGAAIHGGAGTDTAIFAGMQMAYNIVQHDGHTEVSQRITGGGSNLLDGVERLLFDDKAMALDIDGVGGKAYRLYQAAFNRAPDEPGLGYWISNMDKGLSLQATAGYFIGSEEFTRRYGANLSDADFVTQLYNNVLHRAPDAEGYAYWMHDLQIGVPRANLLANFSESAENQAALIHIIGNGFSYVPFSA
ncbi:DUF4214 domain-containing protein [Rugamonas sp. FT82W]|uniref:DUF4214 domain-containing protein n=1 Tax=Duganella vulcania TaxID=2692166 RepID=A0A845G951_9BURK|nr:DUF4214 domain-containing protein [Duganella vulcania]MYM91193.1 DUF4214 domain-containing protein [Duganella vulcania]